MTILTISNITFYNVWYSKLSSRVLSYGNSLPSCRSYTCNAMHIRQEIRGLYPTVDYGVCKIERRSARRHITARASYRSNQLNPITRTVPKHLRLTYTLMAPINRCRLIITVTSRHDTHHTLHTLMSSS